MYQGPGSPRYSHFNLQLLQVLFMLLIILDMKNIVYLKRSSGMVKPDWSEGQQCWLKIIQLY